MNTRSGFIAVPRDLRKRLPDPRDRAAAVELALDAAWGEYKGRTRRFQPGELALSRSEAAARWGCSEKQARGILARLIRAGVIEPAGRESKDPRSRAVFRVRFLADLGPAKGPAQGPAQTRAQSGRAAYPGPAQGPAQGPATTQDQKVRTREQGPEPPNPPPRAEREAQASLPGVPEQLPPGKAERRAGEAAPLGFARLWQQHPKKTHKAQALRLFRVLRLSEAGENALLQRHAQWRTAGRWERAGGQYAPPLVDFLASDMALADPAPESGRQSFPSALPGDCCEACWREGRVRHVDGGPPCSDHRARAAPEPELRARFVRLTTEMRARRARGG